MITMDVKGLDELERQLTALGEKVGTKVLRDAGREALKVVEEDMKQHAGFDDASSAEHMRDSIKNSRIHPERSRKYGSHPSGWPQQKALHESAGPGVRDG
ncbi:hypothetical protein [Citrobacter freundii]|uniref:Uncharacterized protein n=1 Tax=Citrobacter freundii TaxID=546 RepID=A0A7G2IW71_CITFR|nr:hypothetical protein [Citrobacter freundii]